MGAFHSNRSESFDASGEVDFDHFQILRAIGKGAFGKVCIVQKKDTKKMFAMKYMNKCACIKKDAIDNVLKELEILQYLEHPFIVNLWFTFQDEEDMFMVVDLLLGGDIRYHLQQNQVKFDEKRVLLYLCELGLALDYLRSKSIVHRDLKPDNLLLDEKGHVHLTDFNIATILQEDEVATSMSGTKPYMAPEVFAVASGDEDTKGYSFSVDWWSLGVCLFEILNKGRRPFEIHSSSNLLEIRQIFSSTVVQYSSSWSTGMRRVLRHLLNQDSSSRLQTLAELKKFEVVKDVDWDSVERMEIQPAFVPPKDHLNCDPTFELEEMIIEAKPLHKKKKRLAKQNSKLDPEDNNNPYREYLNKINAEFRVYNREKPIKEESPTELANDVEQSNTKEHANPSEQAESVEQLSETCEQSNGLTEQSHSVQHNVSSETENLPMEEKKENSINGSVIQVREQSEPVDSGTPENNPKTIDQENTAGLGNDNGDLVDVISTNR